MSLTLLIAEHPVRQIAIRPPSNCGKTTLVIKADSGPYFTEALAGFQMLAPRPIFGCLGLISIQNGSINFILDVFVGIVSEASRVAEIEGNQVYVINKVNFYCVSSAKYDRLPEQSLQTISGTEDQLVHPCAGLMKLLSTGSFYFSHTFDLSRDLRQRKSDIKAMSVLESADHSFLWNKQNLLEIIHTKQLLDTNVQQEIDRNGLLVALIQGFVGCETVVISSAKWRIGIISRLSSNRAGTRFNARGIDDDGNVSNFVETEFLIYTGHATVSYLQIRGSIPLFWEQTGVQVSHKVKLSRGPESTLHCTRKHFESLIQNYSKVQIVNLLSKSTLSPEYQLNEAYRSMVSSLTEFSRQLLYFNYDFHAEVQRDKYDRLEDLAMEMKPISKEFGYNVHDTALDLIIQRQYGIMRTNCLDCLDRTNVVQTLFAKKQLQMWLQQLGISISGYDRENLESVFNNLWADNGDWLSKIYAGTGALKSSYTRNGFLDDAAKSVNRFYVQNFQDKGRQEAIELLLNQSMIFEHSSAAIHRNQLKRQQEANTVFTNVLVYCGTYNLNGRMPHDESLLSWLISPTVGLADVVVIGCQELIKLTPGEYITADTDKIRLAWEAALLKSLNSIPQSDYVVLRSLHLVALGMFVFVRSYMTSRLREVEISSIKTGLMGMAANKGGIGIRLKIEDTSFAFVTAHFAAGQSAIEERNQDYRTISEGLNFRGKRLANTENVFWFGDFNYRVDVDNYFARTKIQSKEYQELWKNDQLQIAMRQGFAFPGFQEGELLFDPTYKYDNGTNTYDSSEKERVPAWTDRVLFSGKNIKLLEYNRGEQLMSDHRPVRAYFEVSVATCSDNTARRLSGPDYGNDTKLPPPSTDKLKWWETHQHREVPPVVGKNPFFDFDEILEQKPLIILD